MQFGNFLLLNPLGVGGLGTVYKAVDLALGRSLALKILRKKFATQPEFIESFFREARAAAAVTHPNIAQVYSFGEHDGQYYLAMELLERGSLDDRISTLGKLPEKDVLEIGRQIAAGLRAAHLRGLLHRDIKPGNILFGEDNIPKLVDFGLARAQHEAHLDAGGPIWGTPYYIAPEKLRGQPEDHRSDMYSLGATLYHALAGRPPFDAETASKVVTKHATQPAQSLRTYVPTVQNATVHLIGRMLSKNPAERHATYDELLHDFEEAIAAVKYAEQNRVVAAPTGEQISLRSVIATAVLVVIGMAVLVWVFIHRERFFGPTAKPTSVA
ncbi:MAG: serine/threonine protein kinase, partial [Verrucomicrobiae bacterium]|nr:serine/threonine protein kinase [Verrucomicrobiae bacterium]